MTGPRCGPIATLTLTQPWATLVAVGAKTIETRSWATRYRGLLAIHAAKAFPTWARLLCLDEPDGPTVSVYRDALRAAGVQGPHRRGRALVPGDLPVGAVVAVATLVDVVEITPADEDQVRARDRAAGTHEVRFGDFTPGRWAWQLADVRRLPTPVPACGRLGLWPWTPDPEQQPRLTSVGVRA